MNTFLGQSIYRLLLVAAIFNIRAGFADAAKSSAPVDKTPIYKVVSGKMILDRSNILQIVDSDKQGFNGRITIEKGDTFSMLGTQTKPDGITMIEIGLESDFSSEPHVMWVNAQSLQSIRTESYDPDSADLSLNIYSDNAVSRDDDGTPLKTLLSDDPNLLGNLVATDIASSRGGTAKRSHHGGGMTFCLRDVRLTLARMGICHSNSFGAAAAQALGPIEQQCGFTPISYSDSMPKGSVCISQGGNKNCGGRGHFQACGHAAVDIGNGMWEGAGIRNSPHINGLTDMECAAPK